MSPTMGAAKGLSAWWLFLSAKKQTGCPIGACTGVIPDSIPVCNHYPGVKVKSKKYPEDISDHYFLCFHWFLRPQSSVTGVTDVETGLL
jgi:hypothetical protein